MEVRLFKTLCKQRFDGSKQHVISVSVARNGSKYHVNWVSMAQNIMRTAIRWLKTISKQRFDGSKYYVYRVLMAQILCLPGFDGTNHYFNSIYMIQNCSKYHENRVSMAQNIM